MHVCVLCMHCWNDMAHVCGQSAANKGAELEPPLNQKPTHHTVMYHHVCSPAPPHPTLRLHPTHYQHSTTSSTSPTSLPSTTSPHQFSILLFHAPSPHQSLPHHRPTRWQVADEAPGEVLEASPDPRQYRHLGCSICCYVRPECCQVRQVRRLKGRTQC